MQTPSPAAAPGSTPISGSGGHQPGMSSGSDAILQVRNLDFYYGKFQGLKKINLDIRPKQVTAFIGPSGCGKSTLLRTFNRMFDLYPGQRAEGEILFHGKNILAPEQDVNLLRARIGMVFQKPTPFPMTIFENIAFGIRLYENLDRQTLNDRVEWALRKAALWNEVKDKLDASGLSGYRPTVQDKNRHADFVGFVQQVIDFGNKDDRIILVPKESDKAYKMIFEDTDFGYEFKVVKNGI